ncbi:MAG TPA: DUF2442 domain-containing protein [Candidatus Rubrimentiphilum sp.]|nr:DUF2442 domain-containing protein [Candidatus Rubrimentiphilum sp.]
MEKVSSVRILGADKKSLERARIEGEREIARSPVRLEYLVRSDALRIAMPTGILVVIPRMWMHEFRNVPKSDMKKVRLNGVRDAIELDDLDIQISAMGLLRDAVFGDDPDARAGRVSSPAKARPARRNGARGGRPKKKRVSR